MIEKKCIVCNTVFYVKPYREKSAKYCSQKCGGIVAVKNNLNKNHEHLKGNKWRCGILPTRPFEKGHTPWNKGIKGLQFSPETQFKKGMISNRKKPLLTISQRKDKKGVLRNFIKIAEPSTWKENARYVWEENVGLIPKGYIIHHKDRNPLNDDISNLEIMTKKEHINEHRFELRTLTDKRICSQNNQKL